MLSIQNNDSSALCPVLTPERIAVLSSEGAAAESRSDLQRDKREKANLQTKQHLAAATVACPLKAQQQALTERSLAIDSELNLTPIPPKGHQAPTTEVQQQQPSAAPQDSWSMVANRAVLVGTTLKSLFHQLGTISSQIDSLTSLLQTIKLVNEYENKAPKLHNQHSSYQLQKNRIALLIEPQPWNNGRWNDKYNIIRAISQLTRLQRNQINLEGIDYLPTVSRLQRLVLTFTNSHVPDILLQQRKFLHTFNITTQRVFNDNLRRPVIPSTKSKTDSIKTDPLISNLNAGLQAIQANLKDTSNFLSNISDSPLLNPLNTRTATSALTPSQGDFLSLQQTHKMRHFPSNTNILNDTLGPMLMGEETSPLDIPLFHPIEKSGCTLVDLTLTVPPDSVDCCTGSHIANNNGCVFNDVIGILENIEDAN